MTIIKEVLSGSLINVLLLRAQEVTKDLQGSQGDLDLSAHRDLL